MKKRVLSAFMALALCLTLLPTAAWAAETEGGAAQIGDTVYSTLPDAVNAAKDGDTIKLLADYKTAEGADEEGESGLTITKSVTLDLNGHGMDDFRVAQVNDAAETLPSGNLTVEDTSAEKTGKVTGMIELLAGKLTINGGTIGDGRDGVSIENGNLTVNGGTIDFLYGSNSGTVTITGGTVKNARFGPDFEITITGGSGHTGLWNVREGTWNISGGEFEDVIFQTESPAENLHITGGMFGKIARQILKIGGNGEKVPAPISGLLADGYAFYQKTDSEEYGQCVKLTDAIAYLENVQVKGHTHNFVNGVCTDCDYACLHTNMNGDGFCSDCKTQMVAKVEVGDTVTYSADFKEAMNAAVNAAVNGTTVTLLVDIEWGVTPQDRAAITGDGKIVTLNLNGHTITGGWLDIGSNDSPTSCTLKIIGEGSHESLRGSGGYSGVSPKATLDLSEWKGGTINAINILDNSNYEAKTREAAVIVGPKAGTIGKLTFGNNQLGELKKTKLSGGSFNEIWAANNQPVKLGELLADGYAFQNGDGSYVEYGRTLQGASIYNAKVVKCLHPNMKPGETGVATCEYCGKSGKFVASVDGNLYTDMDEAIAYWLANGGTLKLYADYTAATEKATWTIVSGEHSIDLNGHSMFVQDDGAFKPTNNMHLTVTDGTERGQIENILLDGSQRGSFTLESGYVSNLEMTGGAVVALKGGSVDTLDVQKNTVSTNLSIQGGSIGELNIKDWANGMHVSATGGSLGAYNLPSGKILADVLDHQYYAEGTSLDRQEDTAQPVEKFVIRQAPHDFGSTSKAADVPINGSIPFMVDSPSGNVGVYEVKWYRRTNSGAEHMTQNRVAGVNVGDTLDVFCVITGVDKPNGAMQWQVAVKGYTINVVPAMLNGATVTLDHDSFVFDGNSHTPTVTSVTLDNKALMKGTDYTVSVNIETNAGTYELIVTGTKNYTGKVEIPWTIKPHTIGAPVSGSTLTVTKTYDGTSALPAAGLTESSVTFKSEAKIDSISEVTLKQGEDFTISGSYVGDNVNVGTHSAKITITLKNSNYTFDKNTSAGTMADGKITKADAGTAKPYDLYVVNNLEREYLIDPAKLFPDLDENCDFGDTQWYIQPDSMTALKNYYGEGVEAGFTVDANQKSLLYLKVPATADKSDVKKIGAIKVTVTPTNYNEFESTINVNATNKIVPTGEPTLSTKTLTYGQALSAIKLSGTMKDGDKTVSGTFAWMDGTVTPEVGSGTYEAAWKFTPTDGDTYAEADGTVTITVNKAKPAGEPVYTKITAAKKTLADANLKPNTSWPTGTVKWVGADGKDLDDTTEVKANTAYKWVFTPSAENAANYTTATGELTLYSVSTGGGGGGSSSGSTVKTGTVTNPDGSVTKTETKSDGTVVETTTGKDGSVSQTTTNPNGSSVTENKAADGSTGTVKTDKNGQTTAETTLSSKAIETAKRNGEPVKAPVEVKATRDSDTAPTVKIELPKNSGDTKVEIPVSNVKPGTVAVLVHADGTEEIVKNSLPTENGVQLTVNGDATVKVMDNSKNFTDTAGHWSEKNIDFVSARGLLNGTSANTFSPNAPTTRAQLWTVLARQADADLTGGANWYEKAQAWAKEKGISDGANPNGTINRAQMVTMLWRAMGQPATASGASFADVPADSYYAQAVAWAIENGITAGVGGGRFDPNSTCTRAQIATFLRRAVAE